jgi:hypothetical protein
MCPPKVLETACSTIHPLNAFEDAYLETYKKLNRAARRLLARKAKRAIKRYRVKK